MYDGRPDDFLRQWKQIGNPHSQTNYNYKKHINFALQHRANVLTRAVIFRELTANILWTPRQAGQVQMTFFLIVI